MALECLPDSLFFNMTLYLDEEEVKTLGLANKDYWAKVRGNLKIQNRLLVYEFKIARSIISEVKKDPYVVSQGLMAGKELRNGVLINKEPDPLSEVQKIYTSTAYRLHNELYINKQFKLYTEQRRKIEKRLEAMRKEDELYFPVRSMKPIELYFPPIDVDKFRDEVRQSSNVLNYVNKIDNYLQETLINNLAATVAMVRASSGKFCPYLWFKKRAV